jgi:hypothetical protein
MKQIKAIFPIVFILMLSGCSSTDGQGKQASDHSLINNPPIAKDDNATTDQGKAVTIDVLANDSDVDIKTNNDTLTIKETSGSKNAKVSIQDNKLVYEPQKRFFGQDSFSYTVTDKEGATATAKVNIQITQAQKDMGLLEQLPADKDRDVRYATLHLHAVFSNRIEKLSMLKLCNEDNCWSVITPTNKLSLKNIKNISPKYKTGLIAKVLIKDENETIDRIIYRYKGETSLLVLDETIYFKKLFVNGFYIMFSENDISKYLVASIMPSNYMLYMPEADYIQTLPHGVIVKVKKNILNQPAIIELTQSNINLENNVSTWSYGLIFTSLPTKNLLYVDKLLNQDDDTNLKWGLPKIFKENIEIYIPVSIGKLDEGEIKDKFILELNHKEIDYEIVFENNQNYIKIFSNQAHNFIRFKSKR